MKNLNLIFNKLYYSKLGTVDFDALENNPAGSRAAEEAVKVFKDSLNNYNGQILGAEFVNERDFRKLPEGVVTHKFLMETKYPGMLLGSGNAHGSHLCSDDVNMGFSFDYVTGQPYIPGSSVKGVLRSHFKERPEVVEEILKKLGAQNVDLKSLEKEIFENSDVFFDAVVYDGDKYGRLMGSDYLAPHPDATQSPKPILFVKVLPGVRFEFRFKFDVSSKLLSPEIKEKLFCTLLELFGAGAKTNTGYGNLAYTENESIPQKQKPPVEHNGNYQGGNRQGNSHGGNRNGGGYHGNNRGGNNYRGGNYGGNRH